MPRPPHQGSLRAPRPLTASSPASHTAHEREKQCTAQRKETTAPLPPLALQPRGTACSSIAHTTSHPSIWHCHPARAHHRALNSALDKEDTMPSKSGKRNRRRPTCVQRPHTSPPHGKTSRKSQRHVPPSQRSFSGVTRHMWHSRSPPRVGTRSGRSGNETDSAAPRPRTKHPSPRSAKTVPCYSRASSPFSRHVCGNVSPSCLQRPSHQSSPVAKPFRVGLRPMAARQKMTVASKRRSNTFAIHHNDLEAAVERMMGFLALRHCCA